MEHDCSEKEADRFASAITALTAYPGYRSIKTQTGAPDWMKHDRVWFSGQPASDAGVQLMMHIEF